MFEWSLAQPLGRIPLAFSRKLAHEAHVGMRRAQLLQLVVASFHSSQRCPRPCNLPPAAGVPRSEIEMLQQQTAVARLAGEGAAAAPAAPAAQAGEGGSEGSVSSGQREGISPGEVDALMGPSEPVSTESTEDLAPHGGVLQARLLPWRVPACACLGCVAQRCMQRLPGVAGGSIAVWCVQGGRQLAPCLAGCAGAHLKVPAAEDTLGSFLKRSWAACAAPLCAAGRQGCSGGRGRGGDGSSGAGAGDGGRGDCPHPYLFFSHSLPGLKETAEAGSWAAQCALARGRRPPPMAAGGAGDRGGRGAGAGAGAAGGRRHRRDQRRHGGPALQGGAAGDHVRLLSGG